MKITKVSVVKMKQDGNLKAFASITLDDAMVLTGLKIMQGKNGLFVAMPSQKVKEEYKDIYFPVTKEFREEIMQAVLTEYGEKHCEQAVNITVTGDGEDSLPF